MSDQQLILVDGSTFLFRAYHAIREPLANSRGQNTHAVFGTINMLRSLMKQRKPKRIAVVLDAKGKTFRHKLYREYKANREAMPEDLRAQLAYLKEIIPAMGIPLLSVSGVEADDVIGTLATRAAADGFDALLISGDKDLTQLVGEHVVMEDTMADRVYDRDGVIAKFGVPPERMVEYLALVGDASDNVPGVPKVGAKTAVKWLGEFGSLDAIITRAEEISGKVGESLRANLKQLALARELVTIKCDVALDVAPRDLLARDADEKKLREIFTELEFRSWLKQLDAEEAPPPGAGYETVTDEKHLAKWIAKLNKAKIFSVDTETTSLDAHRAELVGLSFAIADGEAAYVPLLHRYAGAPRQIPAARALEMLRPLLQNAKRAKAAQNFKYDYLVLRRHDVQVAGVTCDTMLMSYLLDAGNSRHDLDTLAMRHLGHRMTKFSDVAGRGKNQLTFDQVPLEQAAHYAAEDADITLQLQRKLTPRLQSDAALQKLFCELEMPLIEVLARMETNGVKVDAEMLRRQSAAIAKRLAKIEAAAHKSAGEVFNIASPKQIQEILYTKQGITPPRKTPKGQPSTAESVLQELAHEHDLPRLILEHRGLAKLKSTYADKLPELIHPETGRIHTSFHQAVAATGRLSSSDPNLQNIPIRSEDGRRIREAFVAEPGNVLVSADYSQIELRIMAHLSGDDGLCDAFNRGLDVHRATAAEVFAVTPGDVDDEQRRRAKAINFGLIYGMSEFGLARQLQIERREARAYIDIYFARYPGVKQYMQRTRETARARGYVETLFGRRLHLPEIESKNAARRQYAERTAINAPMQGSAADFIKRAMLAVDKWLAEKHPRAKMILQVHDELLIETPAREAGAVARGTAKLMCAVAELKVPLVVDTGAGANWKDAH